MNEVFNNCYYLQEHKVVQVISDFQKSSVQYYIPIFLKKNNKNVYNMNNIFLIIFARGFKFK
jgi:hypothetical protein